MNNKSLYYRIPVCIFLFVFGSITALLLSNLLDNVLSGSGIRPTNIIEIISNVLSQEKLRQLFLIFEALVILLCVVYYTCSQRTYQSDIYKVTDKISIPMPYGQGQHGTAWFMDKKEMKKMYTFLSISEINPVVQKLLHNGDERFNAVENGEIISSQNTIEKNLFDKAGIVLACENSSGAEQLPCITKDVHTLTIGGTGCGKTRCLVLQSICAIALAGEGIIVNDPKGEIYHYTHFLLQSLGYKIRVIDFQSPRKSDHYNPLQLIIDAVNDDRIDDAQTFAWDLVTFIVEKNDHSEPIWTNGEMAVVAAAILCVVFDNKDNPQYQNLTNVYHFIANMCKSENKVMPIDAYMKKLPESHPAKALIAIAKIAPDRMGGSFYTSALTTLRLFITNDVYRITCESEFSLDDFGKKPKQALFFILPDQKTTFYPIVTLLISQQYEQLVTYAKRHGNRLPYRVNFILDEFGNFTAIADFNAKMRVSRGYGIRWNLFLQDFNQLTEKYGKEVSGIIKGNCRYWIYLQSSDVETNEEISKRLGTYTTSTYSLGGTTQKYASPSSSANIQLSQRNLLNIDEIGQIQRPYQLVISDAPPSMMYSPDISKWLFNRMLGLGNESHNSRLIELDENSRPDRGEKRTVQQIWKPWEELSQASEAAPVQIPPRFSEPGLHNKPPYFRRG